MSSFKKLSHSIYECKYHIVFCPKYRYRIFDGQIVEFATQQLYQLARQKDLLEVMELNVQPDHVHVILSVPPQICHIGHDGILEREDGTESLSSI